MLRLLLIAIYFLFFLLFSIFALPILWLIGKRNPAKEQRATQTIIQHFMRHIRFLSGVKLTVKGTENIPVGEPVLYVPNHRGIFDIVITYPYCTGITGYVAKDSLKKIPLLRHWMKRLHCYFLNRKDPRDGMKMLLFAIDCIKNGISICIFPEGTRNKVSQEPLPFKEGSLKIAKKTDCLVVPIAICNTDRAFEKHIPWITSCSVTLQYGKPFRISELSPEDKQAPGAYTRARIVEMLEQEIP